MHVGSSPRLSRAWPCVVWMMQTKANPNTKLWAIWPMVRCLSLNAFMKYIIHNINIILVLHILLSFWGYIRGVINKFEYFAHDFYSYQTDRMQNAITYKYWHLLKWTLYNWVDMKCYWTVNFIFNTKCLLFNNTTCPPKLFYKQYISVERSVI